MRDYKTSLNNNNNQNHTTGRKCDTEGCGGALKDTNINYGEDLNMDILEKGFQM